MVQDQLTLSAKTKADNETEAAQLRAKLRDLHDEERVALPLAEQRKLLADLQSEHTRVESALMKSREEVRATIQPTINSKITKFM